MPGKSTDLVPFEQYMAAKVDEDRLTTVLTEIAETQDLDEFSFPTIKLPSGNQLAYQIPGLAGNKHSETFEGVIVASKEVRVYWADKLGSGSTPPDCSAPDAKHGYGYPQRRRGQSKEDLEPVQRDCAVCPNKEWGTALDEAGNPTAGQACQHRQILMILPPDSLLPYVVNLAPTSLKAARNFLMFLRTGDEHMDIRRHVVRLGLKEMSGKTSYAQATFEAIGLLSDDELARVEAVERAFGRAFKTARVSAAEENGVTAAPPADPADGDVQAV